MTRAVEARKRIKAAVGRGRRSIPSFNDMVVKACALALREFPRANGAYRDGEVEEYSRVNVGVAVAAQDALVVPTVFDADAKGLRQIATETRALAARVREGTITPPELSGGTFTVSNLGMFGVTSFSAVINPPQAGILAVGSIERGAGRPRRRDRPRQQDVGDARLRSPDPLRRRRRASSSRGSATCSRSRCSWHCEHHRGTRGGKPAASGPQARRAIDVPLEKLPPIDEHEIEVDAPAEATWAALFPTLEHSLRHASSRAATRSRSAPIETDCHGDLHHPGGTLPGFVGQPRDRAGDAGPARRAPLLQVRGRLPDRPAPGAALARPARDPRPVRRDAGAGSTGSA